MSYSLEGFSVHEILQARILEWVAMPFSRDIPNPGIEYVSPALQADSLLSEPPGKPIETLLLTTPASGHDLFSHPRGGQDLRSQQYILTKLTCGKKAICPLWWVMIKISFWEDPEDHIPTKGPEGLLSLRHISEECELLWTM